MVYKNNFKNEMLKFCIEAYFDIFFCTTINLLSFTEVTSFSEFLEFFQGPGNIYCSLVTIICTFIITFLPFHIVKSIKNNFNDKKILKNELHIYT